MGTKCWVITNQRAVAEPVLPASPCEKKKNSKKGFFIFIFFTDELRMKRGATRGKGRGSQVHGMEMTCLEQEHKQAEKRQIKPVSSFPPALFPQTSLGTNGGKRRGSSSLSRADAPV